MIEQITLSAVKAGRFLTHRLKHTVFENIAVVLISASVDSGIHCPVRNKLFEMMEIVAIEQTLLKNIFLKIS